MNRTLFRKCIVQAWVFGIAGLAAVTASAQSSASGTRDIPYFNFGKGLAIISPDSLFLLNIRFRIQNRVGVQTGDDDFTYIRSVDARVRRMRLRFDGFVYDPKLTYVIQLSFTRSDMDYDITGFPNVLRDAMVFYQFNPDFTIGLGQTKLPGNRQRVNSSGDLQFPDRSIVNGTFNVDRDFGLQVYYHRKWGSTDWFARGAITSGEGRNASTSDNGLAYTGRLEVLPFGLFTRGGDYFEGDLIREPLPKLSIGLTFNENLSSRRTGGQLGTPLFEPRDFSTLMTDWLFKYRGVAVAYEFLGRFANNPVTQSPSDPTLKSWVYTGYGHNLQASYYWEPGWEIAARFSSVSPKKDISMFEPAVQQVAIGGNRYLKGHRVKLQQEIALESRSTFDTTPASRNIQVRFQIEVGI